MRMIKERLESLPDTIAWATEQRKQAKKEGRIEDVRWWDLMIPSLEHALETVKQELAETTRIRDENRKQV